MSTSFDPWISSPTQNAAFNLAENIWGNLEAFTHYVALPAIPVMLKLSFEATKFIWRAYQGQPQPQPQPVAAPPQNQGWLSWAWNKVKTPFKYVIAPEAVSFGAHQLWAKENFWKEYALRATSFMRPFCERFLAENYKVWDKGDINFSLRDMAPETVWSKPFYVLRGIYYFGTQSEAHRDAKVLAKTWFESGVYWSDKSAKLYDFGKRFIDGLWRAPSCLASKDAFKECTSDAANFASEILHSTEWSSRLATIVSDSASSWWGSFKEGAGFYPIEMIKLGDQAMWAFAQTVEANTRIPAHLVYYIEMGIGSYLALKLTKAAARLVAEKARIDFLGLGQGPVQNNQVVVRAQAQPPAPVLQQGPAAPQLGGVIAPQQQLVLNQHIGGAPQGGILQRDAAAVPVVPAQQDGAPAPAEQGGAQARL